MSEHRERVQQENIIGLFTSKFKILLFKEQQQQKKTLVCSIVNFHGVNTLPLADFKSSVWYDWLVKVGRNTLYAYHCTIQISRAEIWYIKTL